MRPRSSPGRVARDLPFIALGITYGALGSYSVAVIAAVGRKRGGEEATWLHMVTLVCGVAVVLAISAMRAPSAFLVRWTGPAHGCVVALVFGALALMSVRGISWYYLSSGIVSVATLLLITWLLVRVSLVFYVASGALGQVLGSLVMDEIGAFGAIEREISLLRVVGVLLVVMGSSPSAPRNRQTIEDRGVWHAGVHGESGRCYWSSQWNWVRAGGAFRA
ncbi:MAG: DMT family transporter [Dehalococcoidia bacterium]|uniref:DMT family transporter n=1 Tax=Candidatus Amarobacter glycogenicus TaxID=3140699 RepID=UPI0031371C84|nr:DMT family transporter [Dehalococcoidia bacterium]